MSAPDLITVDRPPVVEVALAVQFEPNTVSTLHAAQLRSRVREDFPTYEEQPARPPIEEDFSPPGARPPISFELVASPPSQRFWFVSRDGSQLIQVQHDLVAENWRRLPSGSEYPRHRLLREGLRTHLLELSGILEQEGERPLKPNWCEVTYVNHIVPLPGETQRPSLDRVLSVFAPRSGGALPPPEDAQFHERFGIGDDERPRGRLNLACASAFRAEDRVPVWVLTLTARILSGEASIDGALATLEEGREWADRAFEKLTTPEMHEAWGLRRASADEFAR